jgi:hypothetical protein
VIARTLLALVAVAWTPQGAHGGDDAPKKAPDVAAEATTKRAERVAADQAALEAELARVVAFGHETEFGAALDQIRVDAKGDKWWPVADGKISLVTVEQWLDWSRPRPGREKPLAIDVELEGHPYGAIVDLSRQLHDHGIEFLFVSFPTRLQIEPALALPELATPLVDGEGAPAFRGMVAANTRFLLELSKAGVEVLDLAPLFVEQRDAGEEQARRRYLYHRWNMHWAPRAIELAADQIAARLAQMPWWRPGPYQEGKSFTVSARNIDFVSEGNGQAPGAQPEKTTLRAVQMVGAPLQREAKQRGPIVLLGDSFANFHKENAAAIHDHLFRATGWPIDVVAPPGGAELQCRDTLRRRGDGMEGKKVVIWLMQEAALQPSGQFRPLRIFEK